MAGSSVVMLGVCLYLYGFLSTVVIADLRVPWWVAVPTLIGKYGGMFLIALGLILAVGGG